MLDIQKASAGSGKTYALARKYIQFLLFTTDGDGRPRLRSERELEDAAPHILAITFTNKATAEMKDRIVARLADLADPSIADKDVTYLADLCKYGDVEAVDVRNRAVTALAILLNNYTDFQVSTIDSFFQTILRTFAFEIGLNDTYQIELDADFVATSALDATMSDINGSSSGKYHALAAGWLQDIMRQGNEAGQKWNIFDKSTGGDYKTTIYSEIVDAVKKMTGENFKQVRGALRQYFLPSGAEARPLDSLTAFRTLDDHFRGRLTAIHDRVLTLARQTAEALPAFSVQFSRHKDKVGHVAKLLDSKPDKVPTFTIPPYEDHTAMYTKADLKAHGYTPEHSRMLDMFAAMYREVEAWKELTESPEMTLWSIYRRKLRLLPLMHIAADKSEQLLREANIVPMDETNSILSRVIGDDDTPFIYERMGTRLDHYLIDEFQDTSALQWDNLSSLITESLSRQNDNLIIGDAKQSIYRFRNADASLISHRVPAQFSGSVRMLGSSKQENTNHRSLRTIVEANNTIFHLLAHHLDTRVTDRFFSSLYANVAQYPDDRRTWGYVEINGIADDNDEDNDKQRPKYYDLMPPLVCRLRDRGYKLSDIAFLVREKTQGRFVIEAIMDYNNAHPDQTIDFISDESLLIAASPSVKNIIAALRLVTSGFEKEQEQPSADEIAPPPQRQAISLPLFLCRYEMFAMAHPELTEAEMMRAFTDSDADNAPLRRLFSSMQSCTLTAMVERICEIFLSEEDRNRDAAYIAAFQDIIIDFCDRRGSDTLSFLQWWDRTGDTASISSPEGMDAVQVMTIHKAKGLEFPCVIIPALCDALKPRAEWVWVQPAPLGLPPELQALMPPYIPIEVTEKVRGTVHRHHYDTLERDALMDSINLWYVAFTRAAQELYLFAPEQKAALSEAITTLLRDYAAGTSSVPECDYTLAPDLIDTQATPDAHTIAAQSLRYCMTIGSPLSPAEIAGLQEKQAQKRKQDAPDETIVVRDYYVRNPSGFLHFRDPDAPDTTDAEDQRGLGIKLHSIMADIRVPSDLDAILRRRLVDGRLTAEEAEMARLILTPATENPAVTGCFDPQMRVITERAILRRGRKDRRPDRIFVSPQGAATVVDYKFGTIRKDEEYVEQVCEYVKALRETGMFSSVTGYVWYIRLNHVVPC